MESWTKNASQTRRRKGWFWRTRIRVEIEKKSNMNSFDMCPLSVYTNNRMSSFFFLNTFFLILHHPSISHRNGLNSWIFLTRCYDERLCIFHILFISIIAWWELMVRPTYVHITSHHIYAIMWCKERLFKGLAQHRRVLFHKWIFCIRFNERVSALLAKKGLHRKKIKFRRRNHHSRTETTFWLAERKKKTSFDNFKPCFSSISSTIFRTK